MREPSPPVLLHPATSRSSRAWSRDVPWAANHRVSTTLDTNGREGPSSAFLVSERNKVRLCVTF